VNRENDRGFTLVELLVVIAIIGLLAGLLLPVVNKVRRQAKKATAREDLHQIVTAWKGYLNDYRRFPSIEVYEMDTNIVSLLGGTETAMPTQVYMEFTTREIAEGFADPWHRLYRVVIDNGIGTNDDHGYDGIVWPDGPGTNGVRKVVAAWSLGPDETDPNDNVRSW